MVLVYQIAYECKKSVSHKSYSLIKNQYQTQCTIFYFKFVFPCTQIIGRKLFLKINLKNIKQQRWYAHLLDKQGRHLGGGQEY
jgi:hypothetical protein